MKRISDPSIQDFEQEHLKKIHAVLGECTLLLKSDHTLPLKEPCRIALFGNGVRKTLKGGTGSGDMTVRHLISVEEGMLAAGFTIVSKEYLDAYDNLYALKRKAWVHQIQEEAKALHMHTGLYSMGKIMPEPEYDIPLEGEADIALYVLSRISGEGDDRKTIKGDLFLTDSEVRQIKELNQKYTKFVLVLNTGGMVDLSPVKEVKNILLLGQLGATTGQVLADLLLGKTYPSGKLTMTWADIRSYPSTVGFGNPSDTLYSDDIYVGYRYFSGHPELIYYPFGFGLSFTEFAISYQEAHQEKDQIHVRVKVKNTGAFKGKEVVQLYLSKPEGKLSKEYSSLVAFQKTEELLPGEEENVTLTFPLKELSSFDEERNCFLIEQGDYLLHIGNSSRDFTSSLLLRAVKDYSFEEVSPIKKSREALHLMKEKRHFNDERVDETIVLDFSQLKHQSHPLPIQRHYPKGEPFSFKEVEEGKRTLEEFIGSLSQEELSLMALGRHTEASDQSIGTTQVGQSGESVPGSAGETCERLACYDVPTLVMADGPAGLRIASRYTIKDGKIKVLNGDIVLDSEFLSDEEKAYITVYLGQDQESDEHDVIYYQNPSALPVGNSLAQSFNPEVAMLCGDVVGEEMDLYGVDLWLSPAMNIQRNPLCGRNFEYYSEDPLVSGRIASGIVSGVQQHSGRGVTLKHFAANNQEFNRLVSNSIVSPRALREIYLKGFEIAVTSSHPYSLMTANNLINDEHSSEKKDLMNDILRNEWGFDGLVMTDWFVTNANMASMFKGSKHNEAASANSVASGNDLLMPGEEDDKKKILLGLEKGEITLIQLQNAVYNILNTMIKMRK